jgi:hypothetical protein
MSAGRYFPQHALVSSFNDSSLPPTDAASSGIARLVSGDSPLRRSKSGEIQPSTREEQTLLRETKTLIRERKTPMQERKTLTQETNTQS